MVLIMVMMNKDLKNMGGYFPCFWCGCKIG